MGLTRRFSELSTLLKATQQSTAKAVASIAASVTMPRIPRSVAQCLRDKGLRDDEWEKMPYDLIIVLTNDVDWAFKDRGFRPLPGVKDVVCAYTILAVVVHCPFSTRYVEWGARACGP